MFTNNTIASSEIKTLEVTLPLGGSVVQWVRSPTRNLEFPGSSPHSWSSVSEDPGQLLMLLNSQPVCLPQVASLNLI